MNTSPVLKDILDTERRVLRRKCRFLTEAVYITDSLLEQLVNNDMLIVEEANAVKVLMRYIFNTRFYIHIFCMYKYFYICVLVIYYTSLYIGYILCMNNKYA